MDLRCDMDRTCAETVTHVDNQGFVYCTTHGLRRRQGGTPCRKLRPSEIEKLEHGETVSYSPKRTPYVLTDAEQFFYAHAGYSYPSGASAAEQRKARIACARELARAETRAKEMGLVFSWEPEEFPWDGDVPLAPTDRLEWVACYAFAQEDSRGRCLASLGMVATTSYHDPYRRVVEAELAEEALATLDEERERTSAADAEELGARATYAGVLT